MRPGFHGIFAVAYGRKHGTFETGELKEGKNNSIDHPLISLLTPYDETKTIPAIFTSTLMFPSIVSLLRSRFFIDPGYLSSGLPPRVVPEACWAGMRSLCFLTC